MVMVHPDLPIKANVDKYKIILICWRETVRSGTILYNDISDRILIVRLCFVINNKLTQNVLHKTVA